VQLPAIHGTHSHELNPIPKRPVFPASSLLTESPMRLMELKSASLNTESLNTCAEVVCMYGCLA
jgi:hypothetical protein